MIVEFFIAFVVLGPTCVRRGDHLRTFAAWHDSPTPATRAELDRQTRITMLHRSGFSAAVFAVMAGSTLLSVRIFGRRDPAHDARKI